MPHVTATIEVARPARAVYDHCADLATLAAVLCEAGPVERTGTGRLRWRPGGGEGRDVEVVENIVNERLVLAPVGGEPGPVLAITIDDLGGTWSRLTLSLTGLDPDDPVESRAGLDVVVDRLRRDLDDAGGTPGDPPVPPPAMAADGPPPDAPAAPVPPPPMSARGPRARP